ncbi:hypothetical protein N7508_007564 [Penicillium antarcticum]|uniref:uncharacterized protein n=1 Tax=Penicillium antarcticum TaxID=416450 RepID=UPI002395ED35|nr:uncharacterized protein N7508_007564 [Penicillium antarcticum]KAJ5297315.1 hypothetical protein N7508_007564 [Penicillium antarcticum]
MMRIQTKLKGAPDYDDPEFWDTRFATGSDVGEWLNSGEALIDAVLSNLENRIVPQKDMIRKPRVLHLGPGVSELGNKLRDRFIERKWQGNGIVNADFSIEAVRRGKELESNKESAHAMPWLRVDLRSWSDVSTLSDFAPFDVILDKSTSDAVATSEDHQLSRQNDFLTSCPAVQKILLKNAATTLKPVELLALQLFPLTQKGSRWIALSYSTIRFDGLHHLADHWTLQARIPLKAPAGPATPSTYVPEIFHWMYILERR